MDARAQRQKQIRDSIEGQWRRQRWSRGLIIVGCVLAFMGVGMIMRSLIPMVPVGDPNGDGYAQMPQTQKAQPESQKAQPQTAQPQAPEAPAPATEEGTTQEGSGGFADTSILFGAFGCMVLGAICYTVGRAIGPKDEKDEKESQEA